MTTEYTGAGDVRRSMQLLWGIDVPGGRGPRRALSIDDITTSAMELADAEGLAGVSMRQLALCLGVGTMSLYRYVPGRAELIDLMVDRACGETRPADRVRGGWRKRVVHVARENVRMYQRHPWMLEVFPGQPPLGPGLIGKYEHELRSLDGIGLNDVEMDLALTLVVDYSRAAAGTLIGTARMREQLPRSDEEWWAEIAPTLEQATDDARYPLAARVGLAATIAYGGISDPERAFEFGLECVLDGIEALVARRTQQ
jgi:AcrR family transcriptional regulator